MRLRQIVYVSRATRPFTRPALVKLRDQAATNNTPLEITGLLLFSRGWFMQMLEGPEVAVAERYETIRRDDRHESVDTLVNEAARGRLFGDWAMGLLDLDTDEGVLNREAMQGVLIERSGAGERAVELFREFRRQLPAAKASAAVGAAGGSRLR